MDAHRIARVTHGAARDLAWLAGAHIALKTHQCLAEKWAAQVLGDPSSVDIRNYPAKEAEKLRRFVVESLLELAPFANGSATDLVGGLLNKAAIVYADAVLQWMLIHVKEAAVGTLGQKRSVKALMEEIDKDLKNAAAPKSAHPSLQRVANKTRTLTFLPYAKWALFTAQLRHLIVHKMGKVDMPFRLNTGLMTWKQALNEARNKSCKPKDLGLVEPQPPMPLRMWRMVDGKRLWPSKATFEEDYKLGTQAALGIVEVVLPCIRYCARYACSVCRYFQA